MTEDEIKKLLTTHPEKAIEVLFQQYYAWLCKVVFRVIPDQGVAEDLVQDLFLGLWKRKDNLSINISLKAYLRRSAVNKSLNYIRDKKLQYEDESHYGNVATNLHSVEAKLAEEEMQRRIDLAIDSLPEKCRIVFVLSRYEDMSYKEIADHLEISIKTVENQISKALKTLRLQLL